MMIKRFALALTVLILLSIPATILAQGTGADQAISSGNEYLRNGKYKEAILEFRKARNLDPNSFEAGIGLGNAAMQLQDWPNAKMGFETAHRASAGNCDVTKSLAYVYMRLNLNTRAITTYEEVVGKPGSPGCDPTNNFCRVNLASILLKNKKKADKTRAQQLLNQVANTETEDTDIIFRANFMLGNLFRSKKNYDKAIQHLETAFEVNPEATQGRYNLGLLYFNKQNYNKALEHLKIGFAEKSTDFKINLMLGYCYKETPRGDEDAIFHLKKACNLLRVMKDKDRPKKNMPHQELAKLYNKTNKPNEAIKVINEGLQFVANDSERAGLICTKAKAMEKKKKYEEAIELFEMVIDDPTYGAYALKQIERQESLIELRNMKAGN
ncbi:MAG: tetratricopeptide repeat protein [bacterium]|nr:tetratricopeptide repeat protein [bacterium]